MSNLCQPYNALSLTCDYSALDTPNLVMTKVGNDFPFRGLVAGANIDIVQNPNDIVISVPASNIQGAYIGFNETNIFGGQTFNPMIFSNTAIPGYFNSGIYNETTGVITIPSDGIYIIDVTATIGNIPNINNTEFTISLQILPTGGFLQKVKGNQLTFSGSLSHSEFYTTGQTLTIQGIFQKNVGPPNNFTLFGGSRTTLSISRIN